MLSQARQFRTRILQAVDGVLFVSALLIAYNLRSVFSRWELPQLEDIEKYLWLAPLVFVLAPALLGAQAFYEEHKKLSHRGAALRILRAVLLLTLTLVSMLFLVRVQYARSVILLVGPLGGVFTYARHELTAWLAGRAAPRRRVLWLGSPSALAELRGKLSAWERSALDSLPDLSPEEAEPGRLAGLLHEHSVNLLVVSLPGLDPRHVTRILEVCEREGVEVLLRPGLLTSAPYRLVSEVFAGEPVFYFRAQSASPNQLLAKQLMDYLLAALLLLVLALPMLGIALAVRLSSRGPAIYAQRRGGLNGRPFTMYKFRTMEADAEGRQPELAGQNEMKGPVFKMSQDPRITGLGRLLRRHSLDELPQLWNVLRGEMSLVGPRPLPLEEVRRFADDAHRRRLSVKPGLTCLWQVSGRNDINDFEDWVRLDLAYIDQWSLWMDCRILFATIPVTLFGRGGR